jgi:hypothetical protein
MCVHANASRQINKITQFRASSSLIAAHAQQSKKTACARRRSEVFPEWISPYEYVDLVNTIDIDSVNIGRRRAGA